MGVVTYGGYSFRRTPLNVLHDIDRLPVPPLRPVRAFGILLGHPRRVLDKKLTFVCGHSLSRDVKTYQRAHNVGVQKSYLE